MGNLAFDITWHDLREHFSKMGALWSEVKQCFPSACGTVTFADASEAAHAASALSHTWLKGRTIHVEQHSTRALEGSMNDLERVTATARNDQDSSDDEWGWLGHDSDREEDGRHRDDDDCVRNNVMSHNGPISSALLAKARRLGEDDDYTHPPHSAVPIPTELDRSSPPLSKRRDSLRETRREWRTRGASNDPPVDRRMATLLKRKRRQPSEERMPWWRNKRLVSTPRRGASSEPERHRTVLREGPSSRRIVPVDEIRFTHDTISETFKDGRFLEELIADLIHGEVHPLKDEFLCLEVVLYRGRLHSMNNRRLHCLKEFQRLRLESKGNNAKFKGTGRVEMQVNVTRFDPMVEAFMEAMVRVRNRSRSRSALPSPIRYRRNFLTSSVQRKCNGSEERSKAKRCKK